ncbi:DNA-directed RNA pol I, largest subunit [Parasponia andersonii]|uniref:DNA-directed RNA polymerase subunit n=1 Tax=Parasponia andersonii TaxID=3476 RepID=A0A2P5BWY1_PARAD|nr:DNA-directed RNA pol I, largest subunit [Parasponia andersonii]
MEETDFSNVWDGEIIGIRFNLASHREICTASVSGSSITHASQLSNPYLGLPLEFGRCESCGTSEAGNCEGHFGYIELPIPIYHPSHVSELRRLLSLLCLKCLKMRKNKFPVKNAGIAEQLLASCCEDASQVSISEINKEGYWYLQLKVPSKKKIRDGFWNFLERYGYRYGGSLSEDLPRRTLLPCEVMQMLKRLPEETRRKLESKGFFPQDGYVLQYLPVPPNCLSVPEISDGITIMSTDPSTTMLKKVLKQVEIIKSSRSLPNFESLEVEANSLQLAVDQYLQARGTVKASRDLDARLGVSKDDKCSSTKVWLEKMRTLFIRKGSGFSSRTVITGDAYKGVNEVGIPYDIAQGITFEEKVNIHNMNYLQELVDNKLCLTFKDGSSTYSLREGSKGHTFLRPGQVVHRRIMDGDIVFINRPPTTHKHSLQALKVYVHEDHTVKINPLICGPLSADFDGDCIHLFYPQSLAAKAEVLELFSLEKQLLSSHSGNLILQLASDSLLSLKMFFKTYFLDKVASQQLAMFTSSSLPQPAFWKAHFAKPFWTALQVLQTALPASFDCSGERFLIRGSDLLILDVNKDISSVIGEIVTSIFFQKGSEEVLKFFDSLQPLLMENIFSHGCSVGLEDFSISPEAFKNIHKDIQVISPLLYHLRCTYNELVELQLENEIRYMKAPVTNFIVKSSNLGNLIDSRSDSAINKAVQQIGFLGLQISDRGKFYSKTLVEDVSSLYHQKYPVNIDYPCAEHGLIRSCFFYGLDPYEEIVHSISTREVIVRSSRGLSEPGTLFKNLMAILRDVVICYDGTVRNVCSNSIIQFEYGTKAQNLYPAGEPVGVLAATAMSNPAYKAVLDSTPSSNSSWEMMKEILLCKVNFRNEPIDRRVILYLNDCDCGRKYCRERAAYLVKNQLRKVSLKDTAVEFMIEYSNQAYLSGGFEMSAGLVGHVHLNEMMLKEMNIGINEILEKCQESINSFRRKKVGRLLKKAVLSVSECCSFHESTSNTMSEVPCLLVSLREDMSDSLEESSQALADSICPFLLETIIKGDSRISSANITWISPDSTTWIGNPQNPQQGELALDVVLEKSAVKQSGDAWRIILDSCLPVLHLIDTRRSIPYGIKQIQELLGISCAFDQAIQRLSTSVSMVSKGVLKEHLILLANSMTCAGNLIGFNSGGYKALSRSLNIQVPFTEAMLTTPKKCFERAAEKCHTDSLTSIVASCSWAKHVSVGTGSRFDILWDTREVAFNQEEAKDVYDFLGVVNTAHGKESTTACLGEEVDEIMLEDDTGVCSSPELDENSNKPVFEDIDEFRDISEKDLPGKSDGWDVKSTSGSDGAWGKLPSGATSSEEAAWGTAGAWDKVLSDRVEESSWGTNGAWGKVSSGADRDEDSAWGTNVAWGKVSSSTLRGEADLVDDRSKSSGWNARSDLEDDRSKSSGWNARSDMEEDRSKSSKWNARSDLEEDRSKSSGWNARSDLEDDRSQSSGWNARSSGMKSNAENAWSGWNNEKSKKEDFPSTKANDSWRDSVSDLGKNAEQPLPDQGKEPNDWGEKFVNKKKAAGWYSSNKDHSKSSAWNAGSFGKKSTAENAWSGWNKEKSDIEDVPSTKPSDSGWGSVSDLGKKAEQQQPLPDQGKEPNHWGEKFVSKQKAAGWSSSNKDHSKSSAWNAGSFGKKSSAENAWSGWNKEKSDIEDVPSTKPSDSGWGSVSDSGKNAELPLPDQGKEPSAWDEKVTSNKTSGWSSSDVGWTKKSNSSPGEHAEPPVVNSSWGKQMSPETSQGMEFNQPASSDAWLSPRVGEDSGERQQNQWGKQGGESFKKGRVESSGGWGSDAGGWKIKKNRPSKLPGGNEDSSSTRLFTATRQRLDMFTSEEQEALAHVEPIMQSIRRVMHKPGYNDGDPLPPEDQSYIVDNVFSYHPDKDTKMGGGIDYFMVNKHTSFQDTRCFYVVTTDGHKEDFSYRKCLEYLIKSKYPEIADSFNGKYFRKPTGGNRERQTTPERFSTPDRFSTPESYSTPEQAETVENAQ